MQPFGDLGVVTAECGERAGYCVCKREPRHAPPHECADKTCGGQWIGHIGTGSFIGVRLPAVLRADESESGDGDRE